MFGNSNKVNDDDIEFDPENEFLLQLDSNKITGSNWNETGEYNNLYFLISKEDLMNFNFDNVKVEVIYIHSIKNFQPSFFCPIIKNQKITSNIS